MLGAEVFLRTLVANGVQLCLANPGTSEMQFLSALDRVPGMRGVLCLFEGVCAGAADGYARMLRKPAATLLHLGPGLANGVCNFHNAQKAHSPIVSIVGDHATWHRRFNSPLASDVEAIARPISGWVHTLPAADRTGEVAANAVSAAYGPPGAVATLIVPADFSWSEAGQPGGVAPIRERPRVPAKQIAEVGRLLRSGEATGFFLGGTALFGRGLDAAGRLNASTLARMIANRNAERLERGAASRSAPNACANCTSCNVVAPPSIISCSGDRMENMASTLLSPKLHARRLLQPLVPQLVPHDGHPD